jgi:uncharacterized protein (TIGR01244 family)
MKRVCRIAAVGLLAAASCAAQSPEPSASVEMPEPKPFAHITNFFRVNDQICTGGQPKMEDFEKMKKEGIRAIINLRQASEHDVAAEEAKAREAGLRYVHIPVNGREMKDEYAAEFLKATDEEANQPAFIHCGSANRVGGLWMIRRVLRDGWTLEKAEEEARKIGLRSEALLAFAKDYIARHTKN